MRFSPKSAATISVVACLLILLAFWMFQGDRRPDALALQTRPGETVAPQAVASALSAESILCRDLASSSWEPGNKGHGVGFSKIQTSKALIACLKASQNPNATAQDHFRFGRVADAMHSYDQAIESYRRAADQGYAPAHSALAYLYLNGEGVQKNIGKAIELFRKAADNNYAPAQAKLGYFYYAGEGVALDYVQARQLWERAVQNGYPPAENDLGALYESGYGVQRNYAKAKELYEKAAALGDEEALRNLGRMYEQGLGVVADKAVAEEWYRKLAEKDPGRGYNMLGQLYWDDKKGNPRDFPKAFAWFKKAVDFGDVDAQVNLGAMYWNGDGVAENQSLAISWTKKAADQGHATAKKNLAIFDRELRKERARDAAESARLKEETEQTLDDMRHSCNWWEHYSSSFARCVPN